MPASVFVRIAASAALAERSVEDVMAMDGRDVQALIQARFAS